MKTKPKAALAAIVMTLIPQLVLAASITEQGGLMQEISIIITGPVGLYSSIIGMSVAASFYFIKREEISGVFQSAIGVFIFICLIIALSGTIKPFFAFHERSVTAGILAIVTSFIMSIIFTVMHISSWKRIAKLIGESASQCLKNKNMDNCKSKWMISQESSLEAVYSLARCRNNILIACQDSEVAKDFLADLISNVIAIDNSENAVVLERDGALEQRFGSNSRNLIFRNLEDKANQIKFSCLIKNCFEEFPHTYHENCRVIFREPEDSSTLIEFLFAMQFGFAGSIGTVVGSEIHNAENAIKRIESITREKYGVSWSELIGTSIDYVIVISPNNKEEQLHDSLPFKITQCVELHLYNSDEKQFEMETIYENQA